MRISARFWNDSFSTQGKSVDHRVSPCTSLPRLACLSPAQAHQIIYLECVLCQARRLWNDTLQLERVVSTLSGVKSPQSGTVLPRLACPVTPIPITPSRQIRPRRTGAGWGPSEGSLLLVVHRNSQTPRNACSGSREEGANAALNTPRDPGQR